MNNDDVVLTEADLTLVQAALRFWAEEMPAGDDGVVAAYSSGEANMESPPSGRPAELLATFGNCRLRYVLYSVDERLAASEPIVDSVEDLRRQRGDRQLIATLLVRT